MSALGDTFRTARESQGLSLADVADRIHIRSGYLAAIEADDWQAIGPAVYARGFIRNYAKFLRLDGDAAVAQFNASPAATAPGPSALHAPSVRSEPSRSGLASRGGSRPGLTLSEAPKRGPSVWALLGVIVAVALVVFVGYEYFEFQRAAGHAGKPPLARAFNGSVPPDPGPIASIAAAATPELRPPAENLAKSSGFAVRLKDSSWLRVTVDGKVAMEGLFTAGTTRSFAGRSVILRVGNAGGVDVTVDGKDLGPLGGLGDVAERSFQL